MNRRLPLPTTLIFMATVVLSACGGSDAATDPSNNGQQTACAITFSGAVSGSLTCSKPSAILSASNNVTSFGMQGTDAGGDTLDVALFFSGAPVAHTYATADLSPVLLLLTQRGGWGVTPGFGTVSLTITSAKALDSGAGGLTGYEVHGTMSATVPSGPGGAGPVTIAATF